MDEHDDTKSMLRVLGLATGLALPLGMASEAFVRHFMLPPDFEVLRSELEPLLTPLVWGAAVTTTLLTPVALSIARRAQARPKKAARIVSFGVGSSLVQVPALLALAGLFFGAQFLPAALAVAVGSGAIVALYAQARRS